MPNRMKGELKNFEVFIFVLALWIMLLVFGFSSLYFFEEKISSLNNFGGFMNLSTSLVSVATIFLLSQAIRYQKKELKAMKKEMKQQRKSIEKEEKLNRTIKYIDEWITSYDSGTNNNLTADQKQYLSRLNHLFLSKAKSKIDFKLLVDVISKYGLKKLVRNEKNRLEKQLESYHQILKNNDFTQEDIHDAEEQLRYMHEMSFEEETNGKERSYTNKELRTTPEEYLIGSVRGQKTRVENELRKLQAYIDFIDDMRSK